jgi:hypothetical protein
MVLDHFMPENKSIIFIFNCFIYYVFLQFIVRIFLRGKIDNLYSAER